MPNHEFPQVILPFLECLTSVALKAHSERNGIHRPVQLQLVGKLSPGEDDHPKAQRAQHGHTLRVRRTALFIEMVRAVVFNPRAARRCIYIDLEIPSLSEIFELVGNIDPMVELTLVYPSPPWERFATTMIAVAVSMGDRAPSCTRLSTAAARVAP